MNELVYSAVKTDSYSARAALRVRRQIYAKLAATVDLESLEAVLDVGVTADTRNRESNFFEELYPHKERITALSDQDASWLEAQYPGLKFIQGDGRNMPLPDRSFDLVFSSAVLEHVGCADQQRQFIAECCRVSRLHVFLTTPNRWHPVEFHSVLPLIHWLPKPWHRAVLARLGHGLLAQECHLNLLDRPGLESMCAALGLRTFQVHSVRFLGFTSNLLLHIQV